MTGDSMKNTIVARVRGGIKDSVLAARRQATPGDINQVQVMWAPRRDLKRVQVMWVPRQDLKRGLVMRVLRLVKNPGKPRLVLTNLKKANPLRKNISPDFS